MSNSTPTGDGVALESTRHPVEVTEAMLRAGHAKLDAVIPHELLREVFVAMLDAQPPIPDISEDSLVEATIEYHLPDDVVERFAIQAALGNNGGEWLERDGKQHYTDQQKEHWRRFVRDLAQEVRQAHCIRVIPTEA